MRYPRLDVLRAAAIFAVFWHHVIYHALSERGLSGAVLRGNWQLPGGSGDIGDWCSFAIGQYGGWGVALFFVISGFCIHLSFLKWQASASERGFWRPYFVRRFFRIYPPYLFALGQHGCDKQHQRHEPLAGEQRLTGPSALGTPGAGAPCQPVKKRKLREQPPFLARLGHAQSPQRNVGDRDNEKKFPDPPAPAQQQEERVNEI
ncbi:MAG: acyltransferase family protein [Chthoniobacterales bacterium]